MVEQKKPRAPKRYVTHPAGCVHETSTRCPTCEVQACDSCGAVGVTAPIPDDATPVEAAIRDMRAVLRRELVRELDRSYSWQVAMRAAMHAVEDERWADARFAFRCAMEWRGARLTPAERAGLANVLGAELGRTTAPPDDRGEVVRLRDALRVSIDAHKASADALRVSIDAGKEVARLRDALREARESAIHYSSVVPNFGAYEAKIPGWIYDLDCDGLVSGREVPEWPP